MDVLAVERLQALGIRPSPQRVAVYACLRERRDHPTADTIFRALLPHCPTLSRTTVYNTMKLFLARGAVRPVLIEDGEVRFDADTSPHAHFKCRGCGRVCDLFPEAGLPELRLPDGFTVEETHFYLLGRCRDCR